MENSMFLSHVKNKVNTLLLFGCAFAVSPLKAIFDVKTDLNLEGLDVVKESAEILAKTVETFPTKQMAIAIIGFIAVSQGIFFFIKGLATFICGNTYRPDGKRAGSVYGLVLCLIGLGMAICGALASLYCINISHYLFGK
jgi:hypothetical protein